MLLCIWRRGDVFEQHDTENVWTKDGAAESPSVMSERINFVSYRRMFPGGIIVAAFSLRTKMCVSLHLPRLER